MIKLSLINFTIHSLFMWQTFTEQLISVRYIVEPGREQRARETEP